MTITAMWIRWSELRLEVRPDSTIFKQEHINVEHNVRSLFFDHTDKHTFESIQQVDEYVNLLSRWKRYTDKIRSSLCQSHRLVIVQLGRQMDRQTSTNVLHWNMKQQNIVSDEIGTKMYCVWQIDSSDHSHPTLQPPLSLNLCLTLVDLTTSDLVTYWMKGACVCSLPPSVP